MPGMSLRPTLFGKMVGVVLLACMLVGGALALFSFTARAQEGGAGGAVNAAAAQVVRTYPGAAPCHTTLQACISGAADGDVIQILPGTYITNSINITRSVSLIGLGATPEGVILQPVGGRMFTINPPGMTASNVISNMTIENAVTSSGSGGAIRINDGSGAPHFQNLILRNNQVTFAGGGGGALRVIPSVPVTLVNVLIYNNRATGAGGGVSVSGDLTIIDSQILSNAADSFGGGVQVGGALVMRNTQVLSNSAAQAGGGVQVGGVATLTGVVLGANRSATLGGGAHFSATATLSATTVISNSAEGGGGVLFIAQGSVIDSYFERNAALSGGGVASLATVLITDTDYISNSAFYAGGGAYFLAAAAVHGGKFSENRAQNPLFSGSGGGLFSTGAIVMEGVEFTQNSADLGGGAVLTSTVSITGATFLSNTALLGGGLYHAGAAAVLTNTSFVGNGVTFTGAGLYNDNSQVVMTNANLQGNIGGQIGGGMYNQLSSVTIDNARFSDNSSTTIGGGMYSLSSTLTLTQVVFVNNQASDGGGMVNKGSDNVRLSDVIFERNQAVTHSGGGVYNERSNPTLTNVSFISNTSSDIGGGIYNDRSSPTLVNVTFVGNRADDSGGGGMYNIDSSPILTNVTFSGNVATTTSGSGGAIENNNSAAELYNVTIVSNTAEAVNGGGGMNNFGTALPRLHNVIIANNGNGDCQGAVSPLSEYVLIKDITSACNLSNGVLPNILGLDPLLGPLQNNGGATLTHAPLPGSPAIDAGDNALCPATDQRGLSRPQGAACDMGAVEAPPNQPPVANAGPDQTAPAGATVTLNGSASTDPDGNLPLSFAWTQTGGGAVTLANATTATPAFTPTLTGVYTFQLIVTDSLNLASAPDSVTITVTNQAPIANAGADQTVIAGATVTLNGSASTDPDGHLPLSFAWTQTGGGAVTLANATTATPVFTPTLAGVYTFQLIVTDRLGVSSTPDSVSITAADAPEIYNLHLPLINRP